jgi:hypothetical protein
MVSDVVITDGIADPKPYIASTDGSWIAMPGYAHTHIAWMRGLNPTAISQFSAVEVWVSPYSADPAGLKPEKMDDWGESYMPIGRYSAGYSRYAAPRHVAGTEHSIEEVIWNLSTREKRVVPIPAGLVVANSVGMTPTHVWLVGAPQKGTKATLLRFSVD